ncbi:MAG: hypothetical protein IPG90_15785 [Bacteroidetes bacterium]|nr:hypothetical protein [Bacteroidota bacterium]
MIARNYSLVVTDNGCTKNQRNYTYPTGSEDWTVKRNAGTNADSNYIGNNDNKDFRIRTNGTQRLRTYSTGKVELKSALKVDTISTDSLCSVFVDSQGVLRIDHTEQVINLVSHQQADG